VVKTPEGLFDASPEAMKQLYYTSGFEIIELNQLKERYYEPKLLPKLLGFSDEKIRDVESLAEVKLFPEVNVDLENANLKIDLENKGGGIGRVLVFVNGKEIASDARGPEINENAEQANITVSLEAHPYLVAGEENIVEVKAYNAEGYLLSRGVSVYYKPEGESPVLQPELYVLCCGVSDYTGDQIDLRYAAKDAEDMAAALQIGGDKLFGAEKTHVYLLSTSFDDESKQPEKKIIQQAIEEIATKARSTDVLVVYLSGHGINWGGQDGDFYYLAKDAYSAQIDAFNDPEIRAKVTLSSQELTELIKQVPALKQVLIIDACASGKAVENLMAKRDISSSTLRALDRMKDRMGMYIITGCTSDAVSYEASKFGQGILTYSLLEGIKGVALREDRFVDVSLLFAAAQERVPELAADIGGIQKPQFFSPYGSQSFDIGELSAEEKEKINLAQPKPMFLLSVFQEEESFDDILDLEKLVDESFRDVSAKGQAPLIFIQAKQFPEAYRIRGQYSITGETVSVRVNLFKGRTKEAGFTIDGNSNNMEDLAKDIVNTVLEHSLK